MLKGLSPLLSGTLLHHLQDMGHGDVLALVDRNYPAHAAGGRVLELPGVAVADAAAAILSVFPVDDFVEPAAARMVPTGEPGAVLDSHRDVQRLLDAAEGREVAVEPVERFAFYGRAAAAYLTVATSEDRPYSCFLLTKGVV